MIKDLRFLAPSREWGTIARWEYTWKSCSDSRNGRPGAGCFARFRSVDTLVEPFGAKRGAPEGPCRLASRMHSGTEVRVLESGWKCRRCKILLYQSMCLCRRWAAAIALFSEAIVIHQALIESELASAISVLAWCRTAGELLPSERSPKT